MNPTDFIHRNVINELIKQGYDEAVARQGANYAIDHYRRCGSASAKGKMFDDCLQVAKGWASKLQSKKKSK